MTDLQNIFSTHHLTSGILDNLLAEVSRIKDMAVDRAIKNRFIFSDFWTGQGANQSGIFGT